MYCLWPYIDPDSDSSDDGSSLERSKYQEKSDGQEQEEEVSVTCSNPRIMRRGDQRALRQLKNEIYSSKIFFI